MEPSENEEDSGASGDDESDQDQGSPRMRDRIRGWFKSSADDPPRVKAKFDGLFTGMPGINDILSDDEKENVVRPDAQETRSKTEDSRWFEAERRDIMNNYQTILSDMLGTLESERREDPDSVPENAEAMVKSVLKQEMDKEIEETKERRARERLEYYEKQQRDRVEQEDVSGPVTNPRVRRLVDESEAEYERQLQSQVKMDEFLQYEAEAFRKAADEAENGIKKPEPDSDLDQWALERLQDMAAQQEWMAADDVVLDILDENMEDLRARMEKESEKGSLQPETMKEWQMYRAIATKMGGTVEQGGKVAPKSGNEMVSDEEVFRRLQSWKEYNEKEEGVREQGGLARGPKLPFEWQELEAPKKEEKQGFGKEARERRMETRKKINRMSVDALQSLLEKSDSARREKLQKEIDYLKRELESNDYLDVVETDENDTPPQGPVDLRDVFSVTSSEGESSASPFVPTAPVEKSVSVEAQQPRPTAFQEDPAPTPPPPPKTAFFSEESDMEVAEMDSKLGTMEDQKLEAMYRKAGARTRAEQEKIKAGYEEFKLIEQEKRQVSGLDAANTDGEVDASAVKYNVSEVMLEGGDIDAEKILSTIGPRPGRTPKEKVASKSSVDEKEVESSLYRSVAAVGGGRFKDDPEAKTRDEAAFSEYLQMEKEMRASVDEIPEEFLKASMPSDVDEEEYAEQAMSGLGPRPATPKRQRVDERYLSDNGGVIDKQEEEEGDDDDDVTVKASADAEVPEWVQREQGSTSSPARGQFLRGEDIDDAFSDDEYEKNMRQLAEYERRRAGKPRQMGIDITEVLGPRKDIDTDDYKDYKYENDFYRGRRVGWGGATFETRKRDLLDYTELDVHLLNALFEQRDAVSATGVSRYMAKINKPFKSFGAIFRLEGVIVDISGLQSKAWSMTAEAFGVRQPSPEEVRMASILRAELVVSDVFAWTTDLAEIRQIASTFREKFSIVFDEWAEENGLKKGEEAQPVVSERGSLAIGEDVVEQQQEPQLQLVDTANNEQEILERLDIAWAKTAETFKQRRPSQEEIVATVSLEPALAVVQVLRWSRDPQKAEEIAAFQRRVLKALIEGQSVANMDTSTNQRSSAAQQEVVMDQNALMELHYRSWTSVASSFGYDRPTSDEVLGAFVLNDPILVVKSGFGWTDDLDEAEKIAKAFSDKLRALVDNPDQVYGGVAEPTPAQDEVGSVVDSPDDRTPSFGDMVEIHSIGWNVSSQIHGLDVPSQDQIRLSVSMDPKDFVERIMRWSTDDGTTARIVSTFDDATEDASKMFMKRNGYTGSMQSKRTEQTDLAPKGASSDDVYVTSFSAWKAVAKRFALPEPTLDQIHYALSVGPEEAIQFGFRWTTEKEALSDILASYRREIESKRSQWSTPSTQTSQKESTEESAPLVQVNPGSEKWINSLLDVEMECGIISHLSRTQVDLLMQYAGIGDLIGPEKRVFEMIGTGIHPTVKHHFDAQQMLAASLRVERRPDHCVVVDASPGASVAARSVEMQSVAWIGSYPRYELLAADATVSRLDELTAMNIRRLFGERIYDQPLLDMKQSEPDIKRKTKTSFDWGDE